jgi:hypothetical protein
VKTQLGASKSYEQESVNQKLITEQLTASYTFYRTSCVHKQEITLRARQEIRKLNHLNQRRKRPTSSQSRS